MFGRKKNKEQDKGKDKIWDKVLMGAVIGGAIGSVLGAGVSKKHREQSKEEIIEGAKLTAETASKAAEVAKKQSIWIFSKVKSFLENLDKRETKRNTEERELKKIPTEHE